MARPLQAVSPPSGPGPISSRLQEILSLLWFCHGTLQSPQPGPPEFSVSTGRSPWRPEPEELWVVGSSLTVQFSPNFYADDVVLQTKTLEEFIDMNGITQNPLLLSQNRVRTVRTEKDVFSLSRNFHVYVCLFVCVCVHTQPSKVSVKPDQVCVGVAAVWIYLEGNTPVCVSRGTSRVHSGRPVRVRRHQTSSSLWFSVVRFSRSFCTELFVFSRRERVCAVCRCVRRWTVCEHTWELQVCVSVWIRGGRPSERLQRWRPLPDGCCCQTVAVCNGAAVVPQTWTSVCRIPAATVAVKTRRAATGVCVAMVTGSLGTPAQVRAPPL